MGHVRKDFEFRLSRKCKDLFYFDICPKKQTKTQKYRGDVLSEDE